MRKKPTDTSNGPDSPAEPKTARKTRSKKPDPAGDGAVPTDSASATPPKERRAASKPKASKPKPDATLAAGPAGPEEPAAELAVTFRTKKPASLKSLAELVEEEKLQPKPRASRKKPPVAEATAPEAKIEEPAPRGRQRGGRRRTGESAPAEPDAPTPETSLDDLPRELFGDDVLVIWRPASARQSAPAEGDESTARRSRRRRRGPGDPDARADAETGSDAETTELAVSFRQPGERAEGRRSRSTPQPLASAMPEPVPAPPARPAIQAPPDAPRVVTRDGVPTIVRDKRVYPPIAFFGSAPDERRAATVLAEIRRAAEAGIHLHSVLVEFEVTPEAVGSAVEFAAYMASKARETDPEAQVILRLVFAAPKNWESDYPDARYTTQTGRPAEPSVCDNRFWGVAQDCLAEFVRRLRTLEIRDAIIGVHLDRGEWFFPEGVGYDTSPAASRSFRDWLRKRYLNDQVAFRAAWFDGQATFATAPIPDYEPPIEGRNFMRTSRRERRWVDYHLFLSDATCSRIADLAYSAKEASDGFFLVGVSYGYTFEWSHPSSGHLSLGKLLRTREVDFIAGPPSYRTREPGGDAPFPCPVDSLALNGKLYFSEEDYKTAIGENREPDDYNPVIRTPQALESVHWRGAGSALAHGAGLMWMDLWGNGWLNTSTIWERGAEIRDLLVTRMAAGTPNPDVAVFIDERALAYLVDQQSFALLVQDVRESVLRSGLSAGFYLLSDLAHRENFPECKLSIFLNAWDIRPEHRSAIKNRLQRDNKVLFWLYCAGMFDNGRESLERAREVTGIAIKPQPFHSRTGTTVLNRRHPLCEAFQGQGLIGGASVDPSYFAIPENALVLGEYSASGLPSFVIREFNEDPDPSKHWKSVFLGEPFVTPGLLRALAQIAGCHIWNYHGDVVHVRPPFLTIHCTGAGPRAIALPRNWEAYNAASGQWETEDSNNVRFTAMDGSTHAYLVGYRAEIEALLAAQPADLLRMEELPPAAEDTLHHDAMNFDVPIMRLDEVFGDTPDDVGDEWFLRPGMLEIEDSGGPPVPAPEEEKVGRRRRPRNRKGERGGRGAGASGETFDDELGMSVLFRKRE